MQVKAKRAGAGVAILITDKTDFHSTAVIRKNIII